MVGAAGGGLYGDVAIEHVKSAVERRQIDGIAGIGQAILIKTHRQAGHVAAPLLVGRRRIWRRREGLTRRMQRKDNKIYNETMRQ
jgi:hypothetical protein